MKNPEFAGITENPTLLANGSENVFGAVNQQTRQSLAFLNALPTLTGRGRLPGPRGHQGASPQGDDGMVHPTGDGWGANA